ncbi:MAG TPA: Holliday junction resolvase RuvX [Usitatibacter sp.]|nr:Holliday junction resolvase RuvX [Usitatibacter sp.]
MASVSGTVFGFDFGEKRVGIAVGETATGIASPLAAIEEIATAPRFEAIGKLVEEWKPAAFVVGVPRHADGSEHAIAKLAEKFARRLESRYGVPVVFVDETLSSATAESDLRGTRTRAGKKTDIDMMAATIILQSFLDTLRVEGSAR